MFADVAIRLEKAFSVKVGTLIRTRSAHEMTPDARHEDEIHAARMVATWRDWE